MGTLRFWAGLAWVLCLAACAPQVGHKVVPPGMGPSGGCDQFADVGDRVFYGLDKASLTADARDTIRQQADWLHKYPAVHVLVAGNADERGTETYNLALGAKRADAARDQLVVDGVAAARITTVSYGKDCPVAAGHDVASWQQNRNAITSVQGYNPQNCH